MNRHEKRRQRTRQKLQAATMELLLEKGYDTLTVQDITDRADLGRGTFYIHFTDKEEIVWSIVEAGMIEADRVAHQHIAEDGMPDRPAYAGYVNMFRHADENRDLYRIMLGSQGVTLLTNRAQDFLAADLEREMVTMPGDFSPDVPPGIVAQIVTGAIVRLILWWLESDNDYTPEQMAEMLYMVLNQ